MLSTIIWTLCFLGFVGYFSYQIWNRISVLLKLPAAPRLDRIPERIKALLVYGIGQLLEGYVLIPYLVGDRIGLHPLAVIFALLAFGQLFGFAGVLLALPASAALLVGLRHLRAAYVESPVYRGSR